MPVFRIHHITKYKYDRAVKESANQIKLYGYNKPHQEILSHELHITGDPIVNRFTDYWENTVGYFSLAAAHDELIIDSRLIAKTHNYTLDESMSSPGDWQKLQEEVPQQIRLLDLSKKESIQSQHEIEQILSNIYFGDISPLEAIKTCSAYIFNEFRYIKGITSIETTVDEILAMRSGVCQDFAHVLLQLLRTIGIPSRYVSGYICPNKNGMRGEGATHAWVEAYIPNIGWTGVDPTNNCFAGDQHIQLAVGRDFNDCTSVKGTFKGPAIHDLMVYVSVGYEDGSIFEDENTVQMFPEKMKNSNTTNEQAQQ